MPSKPVLTEGLNLGDLLKYEAPNLYSRDPVTIAAGVLIQSVDAHLADRDDGLMVARHAIVADRALAWPTGMTVAEKKSAIAQLKALGILVRVGI